MHQATSGLYLAAAAGCLFLLLELACEIWLTPVLKRLLATNRKLDERKVAAAAHLSVTRIVGFVHNSIQIPLAFMVLANADLRAGPLFATNELSTWLVAIAAGFFAHDFVMCAMHIQTEGPLYLLHAVSCSLVYGWAVYSGSIHYYGAAYMLWELSTPFVHLRWFMYKLGWDHSQWYLYNGLAMMVVFFLCRNVWGLYVSYLFFLDSSRELGPEGTGKLSVFLIWFYRAACVALNGLNAYWMSKMVSKVVNIFFKGKKPFEVSDEKDE